MNQVITPTIGRKVWFRPNGVTVFGGKSIVVINQEQPLDATVVFVWGDRVVNLLVLDHEGNAHQINSVTLRQPGDVKPSFAYCEWMPYQQAQAKKEPA